jgi:type IV secretion system protein VirD4
MKDKNGLKTWLPLILIGLVILVGIIIGGATREEGFVFDKSLITNTTTIIIIAVGMGLILLYYFSKFFKTGSKSSTGEGVTKEGSKISQYYDARFITEKELATLSKFNPCTWDSLNKIKKDGIVIRSKLKGKKLQINLYDPIHTMIIGTTGSGKTQTYINPSIRILSQIATKPCLVITDPKGEVYRDNALQLKAAGYRIEVLDLRNPYASNRWNPMDNAFVQFHRALNIQKEVKIHRGDSPKDYRLKLASDIKEYGGEWYEFNRSAYSFKEQLRGDLESKAQELKDAAENELREIAASIVPIESKTDSSWERGAQDFIYGIMLAMLEDSTDPELGMTREKFNFYNMANIATYRDNDPDNPFGTLRKYCAHRSKFSKVTSLTATAINNAPNTTRSYMGVLMSRISIFQDAGICYATSFSDMSFDDFIDQPTAFFIKVPDEKESRHCIATMCVSQLYKKLVEKASETESLKLKRNVYFMLDEFANLPKIEKMDSMVTVGRSRGLFFSLVIQSYSQLDNKYGKEAAETIRSNCNIQIFIGTEDQKTREEFSKMCGDISIELQSTSETKNEGKDGGGTSKTKQAQRQTRPLIYPYELGQLDKFNVIVKIFQQHPIKTAMTPFFKTPQFDKRQAPEEYAASKALNEDKIFYDINIRNRKVTRGNKGGFDDFDF